MYVELTFILVFNIRSVWDLYLEVWLIIREMQIKSTMRYDLTPVRLAIIKNQQTTSADEDVEKGELFCTVGGNADLCSHCGKHYGISLKK